jgi:hypothetical protein
VNRRTFVLTLLPGVAAIGAAIPAAAETADQPADRTARPSFFVGLDTSGSFMRSGYDDALSFLSHYLYGHLNGLGGLAQPRELFVAGIGGNDGEEAKSFHPIHDFLGKDVRQIESDLRRWYPPKDTLTDFNAFFRQVARIAKERGLLLSPITLVVVSDGVPDVPGMKAGSQAAFGKIDMSPLEYLTRNVTVRLVYANPTVGEKWRRLVPRQRVRMWTVDQEVMKGWRGQVKADTDLASQTKLWKWVRENVDYRVRRGT